MKTLNTTGPNKEFESIKHIDENDIEFWTARETFSFTWIFQMGKVLKKLLTVSKICLK